MYLKVVSGMPSEPTEHVMVVSHNTRLKYPSRVGPMTRAMTTVVNSVQTSVITTSKPMKMKLRPITLALLGAGIGNGMVKVVKSILGFDRTVRMPTDSQNRGVSGSGSR